MGMRESSKTEYNHDRPASIESITTGCLQRIADATEAMAQYHVRIIKERDEYKTECHEKQQTIDMLRRRVSAYQGVITKLKKKG